MPRPKRQELRERKSDSGRGDEPTRTLSMGQWQDMAPKNEERSVPGGHPNRHKRRGRQLHVSCIPSYDSQMGQIGHLPQKRRAGCSTRSQSPLEQNIPHANTRFHPPASEVPVQNSGLKDNVLRSRLPPVRVDRGGRLP